MNIKHSLLLSFLALSLMASAQQIEINEENFPDENFRNYLLEQSYSHKDFYGNWYIWEFDCDYGITYMHISNRNIKSLKGIEYFSALQELFCDDNQLTSLDVSKNTELTILSCCNNLLTSLNASNIPKLEYLYCFNNQLTSLDVSNDSALVVLKCELNQLASLDVSKNPALVTLVCSSNQITSLSVSNNNELLYLWCFSNQLRGEAMDALIDGLPLNTADYGKQLMVYYDESDGNICTTKHVAAAKEKGWVSYCYNGTHVDEFLLGEVMDWLEYEGYDNDPNYIAQPTTEMTEANAPVYNLAGQRIESLKGRKGIFIVGGKKVLVK